MPPARRRADPAHVPAQTTRPSSAPPQPPRQRTPPGRRPAHAPKSLTAGTYIRRWLLVLVGVAALIVGGRFALSVATAAPRTSATAPASALPSATPTPTPTPSPTPPPPPEFRFRNITPNVAAEGFFSWAVLDRRTGEIFGSPTMTGTTWPASMIKAWLAADFLRRATEKGQKPNSATMAELDRMIRDSDNNAAEDIYERNGSSASINRLISICKLTDTKATSKGWSFTTISARDTVRMADCIASGTGAGPTWTAWLLEEMRTVRVGDWGIRKALPPAEASKVSIKNGWLFYDDDHNWHINCLAVSDTWAMAVLQRYPGHGKYDSDFAHGIAVCKDVATQLLNPAYVPSP